LIDGGNIPDFRALADQLAAYAVQIFAEYGLRDPGLVVCGTGRSIEDFLAQVLADYATGKIKYQSSKGELISLLGKALKRDIHDALIRKRSHLREENRDVAPAFSDDEEATEKTLDGFQHPGPSVDDLFDEQEYKDRVRAALNAEPDLVDLADTSFELNIYKRQEQAEVLGITPEELDNRKKRLRRRLIEYGFFDATRKQ
jgi:DNA-directed RNA polymerase specialized sigma24 family protein